MRNEHGGTAAIQSFFTPVQRRLAGNCHLNRDIGAALREADFTIEMERRYGGGMFPIRLYAARPPGATHP